MSNENQKETVIFICNNNAGRSQMAEGLLRHLYGEYYQVFSAGFDPSWISSLAVEVMGEIGIDISKSESKNLKIFQEMESDYVVTLCGSADEPCPVLLRAKKYIHHSFRDLRGAKGTEEEKLILFRSIRDEIKDWIQEEFAKAS
ncbi:MAG TPA: arsenate reductase ArsC [Methanobacterium sp.]